MTIPFPFEIKRRLRQAYDFYTEEKVAFISITLQNKA